MDNRNYWNVVITSIGGFLGQNLMQVVDLLFCRNLGAAGSATIGSATALTAWFIIIGFGMMWSLEYYIPHSLGSQNEERAQGFFYSGFLFAGVLGILSGIGVCIAAWYSPSFGIQPTLIHGIQKFCYIVSTSYVPIFLSAAARIELQARGQSYEATLAYVWGNILNIFLNWVLVLGHLGVPALGTDGSAWANTLSRYGILIYLVFKLARARRNTPRVVRLREIQYRLYLKQIINMGFPSALHMIFEIGAFALVGTLAGQFSNAKIAAHSIAISIASLAFMVPLGLSSAASLTMSEANGRGDRKRAIDLGRTSIRTGMITSTFGSLILVLFRRQWVELYTADLETIEIGSTLILIAAFFQFGDAMQVILAGCIRGFGETKIQAKMNGIGHWGIGIPVGLFLGYKMNLDVVGFWIGLCLGLCTVASGLYLRWRKIMSVTYD